MTLPNFMVVGAAKAGTTALYEYLRQHPDVFMSRWKEPKYFAFDPEDPVDYRAPDGPAPVNASTVRDRSEYESLFAGAVDESAIGEATAIYLYSEVAPRRIAGTTPDARIVAILRNPVDRAFSSWTHLVRDGREPLAFRDALEAEPERIAQNYGFLWRYVDLGWYSRQLDRYEEWFPTEQMLVLLYDDLRGDPVGTCQRVFAFLGVDETFVPDTDLQPNRSGQPRNRLVHRMLNPPTPVTRRLWDLTPSGLREPLRRVQTRLTNRNLDALRMSSDDRALLVERFRPEVERLEVRLHRDLHHWLEPTPPV